jgi:hypothetical protein
MCIVRTIRNTQTHSVSRMQSFSVLKQEVHAKPLGSKGLLYFKILTILSN